MDKDFEFEYSNWAKHGGDIYASIKNDEAALYNASRALKFKAREMRKLRMEREALAESGRKAREYAAKLDAKKQGEEDTKKYKEGLDTRVRKALLEMAASAKRYGLAFDAPASMPFPWETEGSQYKDAFSLIDIDRSDPARSGRMIKIRTMHNGFNWD